LATGIGTDSAISVTEADLKQPDVLLGELEDHCDVDVHVRAAERIGRHPSL
jgi:hypothetical protein